MLRNEEHFARKYYGLCRSLEYRTRGRVGRGAEKSAILAKINMPSNAEVGLVATTTGAARRYGKEKWDPNFGASFHMSHIQAGMTAYKKASAGTTVEVANRTISPVDGFGTVEVDLDQPGTTTKPVKSVGYVPGLPRNVLSTRKAVEQWGKPLVYYETKAVLGFPGDESLVFDFSPRNGMFTATGLRRTPSQGAALGLAVNTIIEAMSQWGACTDVRRSPRQVVVVAVTVKAHGMVEVHRVLAHPSEEITQKTVQTMGIATTG